MLSFASDGVRIAYIDHPPTGPDLGEPILLIHGFGSNHAVNWVNTLWVKVLAHAGRRVIALDNRGHGESQKLYDPADYHTATMAEDARRLIVKRGIRPQLRQATHGCCSIGYQAEERKWYGWSHRAIYGFGVGHRVKKGDGGAEGLPPRFVVRTLADAKRVAEAFAESVS